MELSRICTLQQAKKLLRLLEICLLLLLLTWTSRRLPLAGACLRRLVAVAVSHLFVFLLSNAIVLTLFLKSRGLFLQHDCRAAAEFCREIVETSCAAAGTLPEEIVYQDKGTIVEVSKVRVHRRSQSERFGREKCGKQLRRSETERRRRVGEAAAEEEGEVVDRLSNEEFQRAIEEFIAKQVKFHQEEKLAIVVHGCN